MKTSTPPTIWTIGHSTRSAEEFVDLLTSFGIEQLADIRRYPGSKRYPHFNKTPLQELLNRHDIGYCAMEALGGRRKENPDSVNTGWRIAAFRGYADYMQTEEFKKALLVLEQLAHERRTAYMCSEAVWWSCHRALVSDYLKWRHWTVLHIMGPGKTQEHPYTAPAHIENGELIYTKK